MYSFIFFDCHTDLAFDYQIFLHKCEDIFKWNSGDFLQKLKQQILEMRVIQCKHMHSKNEMIATHLNMDPQEGGYVALFQIISQ